MKLAYVQSVVGLITLLLSFAACQKTATDELCDPNSINIEQFDQNLQKELDRCAKGYTYVIMQNGKVIATRSEGAARSFTDGYEAWSTNQKMHIASISKTITTVATLRVLEMKGLSPEAKIADFLPPHWSRGPAIEYIDFRDLLSHRTGLLERGTQSGSATRYDSLRMYVAIGANGFKTRRYANSHHALMRVILPVLWDYPNISGRIYDEAYTNQRYEEIVQQVVFAPLGIEAALNFDHLSNGVLAYISCGDEDGLGKLANYQSTAGGFGWVMSANDLAKFWAYLWHSESLITASSRAEMYDYEMGLYNSGNAFTGDRYWCKLGGWNFGNSHWLRSGAFAYQDGTGLILFVNSKTEGEGFRDMVNRAYEASFGCF